MLRIVTLLAVLLFVSPAFAQESSKTEDQKTVVMTAYATWRIADAKQFLKAVRKEETAQDKLRDLLDPKLARQR